MSQEADQVSALVSCALPGCNTCQEDARRHREQQALNAAVVALEEWRLLLAGPLPAETVEEIRVEMLRVQRRLLGI